VSPQLHGWNRISIYLALFGLTALAWLLNRGLWRLSRPWPRHLLAGGLAVLLLVGGLYDQFSPLFVPKHAQARAEFQRQRAFAAAIEATLPPGSAVYQWPASPFPFDNGRVGYSHFHLYLHTHGLRLSDPTMLNRRGSTWKEHLESLPVESFLDELARAGFDGLVLYVPPERPESACLLKGVQRGLKQEPLCDGQMRYFFDLRRHAADWRARTGERTASLDELCPLSINWGASFRMRQQDKNAPWPAWRWNSQTRGELTLTNHSAQALVVDLRLRVGAGQDQPCASLRLGGLIDEEIDLRAEGTEVSRRVRLLPGAHRLSFTCTQPKSRYSRGLLWFRTGDLEYRVVEDSPIPGPEVVRQPTAGRAQPR
jgi:phosphoglycerol transferase